MVVNQNPESTGVEIEAAAVEFARGAGDLLAGHFGRALSVEYKDKAQQDPVTAADKETQAYLVDQITRRFPEHGILGEEDDASADGERSAADYLWVLDPLDGTTNFAHGFPVFAVSIAYEEGGEVVAGAVLDPLREELFTAEAGRGAHLNGVPIRVSPTADMQHALLATGFALLASLAEARAGERAADPPGLAAGVER